MLLSEVPIVLAFTPNYFVPAATCLYSILKHSAETESFHVICLLTEELPQQMKDKLQRLGNGRIRYSYIDLNGKLQGIYVDDRYTIAASYRLSLPDLLPEYNKVMYIDCDVIVRNNLYELYHETDLGNNYLAAVFEASLDFQILYIMSIGCEPGRYINSGFLIMNLEKLRKENMVAKFLEAARVEGLQFPDQDVLNQLCKGYILGLPPYYNGIRTFFLPQYKEYFLKYYSEENWREVQQHGTIHYTGTKPWSSFTIGFNVWWEYYEHLPEEIKSEWVINRKIFVLHKLSNTVLGNLFITSLQSVYRKLKRIFNSVKTINTMRKISQFPLLKQLWAFWREKKILDKHQQVADYWDVVIDDYKHGKIAKYNITAKQEFRDSKIIWQYWGQGTNSPELPEVVKICFDSVDQYKGDYIVIRLNDENLSEYIDLPEFVLEKKNGPVFNRTFFSDVLRLALLKTYGGVWLDATVMLTGNLPGQFSSLDYFVYQRDPNEQHKDYWENVYAYYWGWNKGFKVCMLTSIFFAKKGSVMVSALLDLMLYYWKTQNDILDYFFFQILYKQLTAREYINEVCPVVSDTIPHIIQTKLSGGCKYITYEEALKQSNIHKLTYKDINIEEFMTFVQDKTNINLVK